MPTAGGARNDESGIGMRDWTMGPWNAPAGVLTVSLSSLNH